MRLFSLMLSGLSYFESPFLYRHSAASEEGEDELHLY